MRETVDLAHKITIGWPAAQAVHLFTPRGEELWVDNWAPRYIFPATGETGRGMVFKTDHGSEETWWTCLDWEPDRGRVRYLRINPGSRVSFVTVSLAAASERETNVDVSYQVTPLAAGRAGVPTQAQFSEQIETWRELVNALPSDAVAALSEQAQERILD